MFILVFQIFDSVGYPNSCIFSSKLQFVVHNKQYTPLLRPLDAAKEVIS